MEYKIHREWDKMPHLYMSGQHLKSGKFMGHEELDHKGDVIMQYDVRPCSAPEPPISQAKNTS